MKIRLRRALAMIALIAFVVTLLPFSALAEAKTSFVRSQIDSRPAKPNSEVALGIEIVPHKTDNPKRSEIWDGSIATGFAGGNGTQGNPYLISDGSELAFLARKVNNGKDYSGVYFKLTNDIYLNDTSNWTSWGNGVTPQNEWVAIGISSPEIDNSFYGCFDGNGYAVHGIYQEDGDGLFGSYCGDTIANLGIAESYIRGDRSVGGVAGFIYYATVTNCYNTGTVIGNSDVGGVAGCCQGCTVTNCYNTGSVAGDEYVGGVFGSILSGSVTQCYNTGVVVGNEYVSGIVGWAGGDDGYVSTVANCYSTGSVSGDSYVGGVAGNNFGNVTNCYNIGAIIGGSYVGGVVGRNDGGTITNCYYSVGCCSNGNSYGTALTSQQLLHSESFVGFNFGSVWTMGGNPDYPYPELVSNIHAVTTKPGDANGDGSITMADATIISRMALNLTESVPAADFNGDGNINMADATLTARKALNLI